MYKYPVSTFPELDAVKNEVDPFFKLFQNVMKFQKSEKKWLYGNFKELNSEQIEGELDEYFREIYKIQKHFNSKGLFAINFGLVFFLNHSLIVNFFRRFSPNLEFNCT